ncbi:MAG: hypothetical protein R2851_06530 [Caldilineaceae bacterium]
MDRTYQPDPVRHETYQFYVQKYQETYRALRPLMREMAAKSA